MIKQSKIKITMPPEQFISAFYGRNKGTKWELLFYNCNPKKRHFLLNNKKAYQFYKIEYAKWQSSNDGIHWVDIQRRLNEDN